MKLFTVLSIFYTLNIGLSFKHIFISLVKPTNEFLLKYMILFDSKFIEFKLSKERQVAFWILNKS